jgi:hypothetical protein
MSVKEAPQYFYVFFLIYQKKRCKKMNLLTQNYVKISTVKSNTNEQKTYPHKLISVYPKLLVDKLFFNITTLFVLQFFPLYLVLVWINQSLKTTYPPYVYGYPHQGCITKL